MKTLLTILITFTLLTSVFALDENFVRVNIPDNHDLLKDAGFKLFHRSAEHWYGSMPSEAQLPPGGIILGEIDLQSGDYYRVLLADPADVSQIGANTNLLITYKNEAVIQATQEDLQSLPPLKADFIRISTTPKPMDYSGIYPQQTDEFHPMVQEFVDQVSQTQYVEYVRTLQEFVTRNTFTPECDSAGVWIMEQLASFGLDAYQHPYTFFSQTEYNIVGELTGVIHPDSIVYIVGHYDATIGSPWSSEPLTPGADDNGSGVACFLECARILSQYSFEKTIQFVAFSGEEAGLWGSEGFVEDLVNANVDVVGCFNYDMIGWEGDDPLPRDLMVYTDNNPISMAMADLVEEAILTFVPDDIEPQVIIDPGAQGSDHASFWDAGYPACDGIEAPAWGPEFNPYYHSVDDLLSNMDVEYAVNCTKAALAALAQFAGPIPDSGPALMVSEVQFEEISGNGNTMPDAGETLSMFIELTNAGVDPGMNISAVLTTSDPYLTVNQGSTSYPNLNPQESSFGAQAIEIEISASCLENQNIYAELEVTADGGYQSTVIILFVSGDPLLIPSGPDGYGYYAYDMNDGLMAPQYEWLETAPLAGGSGDAMEISTNQTVQLDLPFNFTFYGENFDRISVCSNGWMCFGDETSFIPVNLTIPHTLAPNNLVAPFWDTFLMDEQSQIATQYYPSEHKFVIEWYNLYLSVVTTSRETFEVVLYDPEYYPTYTGNGDIVVNYLSVQDHGYSTVGIEDGAGTTGLQYVYNGNYDPNASPFGSEFSIRFSTEIWGLSVEPEPHGLTGAPGNFYLEKNYPNPFNPITTFRFGLPSASDVSLVVYDVTGRQVAALLNGFKQAGTYSIAFNAENLSSGVYFARFQAGDFTQIQKMLLVK